MITDEGKKVMPLSLYDTSIGVMTRSFDLLSRILDKAAAHAEVHHLAPAELVEARLAPDMITLAGQVQRASDTAKGCAARLAGIAPPSFADDEASLSELQERIRKTVGFLHSVSAIDIEAGADRTITLTLPQKSISFPGRVYLLQFALPNFFFHVTTAYDILRHRGVALGKMDFLGEF
jgi:hypothetical protein